MVTIKSQLKVIWGAMGIMAMVGFILWLIIGDYKDITGICGWSGACILYGIIQSLIILQKK